MDRETRKIILPQSKCEVEIVTFLTWGENEQIQSVFMKGAQIKNAKTQEVGFDPSVMLESKYTLLEIGIKNIKCGEVNKGYSKEWVNNLSIEDGDFLYGHLNNVLEKKK